MRYFLYVVVLRYGIYRWSFELGAPVMKCDLSVVILVRAWWYVVWRRLLSHILPPICRVSRCIGHVEVHPLVSSECWVTRVDRSIVILSVPVVEPSVAGIWWLSRRISDLLIVSAIRSGAVILSVRSVLLVVVVWTICRGWFGIVLKLPVLREV